MLSSNGPYLFRHFFLSHYQKNSGDQCGFLSTELLTSGDSSWWDQMIEKITPCAMIDGVRRSIGYFSSKPLAMIGRDNWCLSNKTHPGRWNDAKRMQPLWEQLVREHATAVSEEAASADEEEDLDLDNAVAEGADDAEEDHYHHNSDDYDIFN